MVDLMADLEDFLRGMLGKARSLRPWDGARRVPAFVRGRYVLMSGEVLSRPVVFVFDPEGEEPAPSMLRKHLDSLKRVTDDSVIYVRGTMSAYSRRRLIGEGIAFIVPGRQVFLPDMGIDLRERFDRPKPSRERFRPATQVVLLWALLRRKDGLSGGRAVARTLGFAPMTLSRAMDEIEAAGLAARVESGRERAMRWTGTRREVWERAQERLADPVQARHLVRHEQGALPGPLAGISALAACTMLGEPDTPVCAMHGARWAAYRNEHGAEDAPFREPGVIEVEVWAYDPALLGTGDRVDPLSLYLSLRNDPDERVEMALEGMMEEVEW
jgi:DNA-binding MarR family transcriptional regulator